LLHLNLFLEAIVSKLLWIFSLVFGIVSLNAADLAVNKQSVDSLAAEVPMVLHGFKAMIGDRIELEFVGKVQGGDVFSDTKLAGSPFAFILGQGTVIKAWEEKLIGVQAGQKYNMVVPPELGYGDQDLGVIPPNSTLEFEMEIVSVSRVIVDQIKNLKKDSLKEISPGVLVYDEHLGKGEISKLGDKLKVRYTGWLKNGREVSSNRAEVNDAAFVLGAEAVIPGWEKGLVGIRKGSVRWLELSPSMGYAEKPLAKIPPFSTLIYKVEVMDVSETETVAFDIFPNVNEVNWNKQASGLKTFILEEGDSNSEGVKNGESVSVHYTGWLMSGKSFDSSRKRGTPFTLVLGAGQVILGWDIGLEGMLVGEKRYIYIPWDLAYGAQGSSAIPPKADLVFLVERTE
jgi:FKBP-type peptidyl-prolyl cis-trans isomerase